jgi:hypothetical protein
MNDDDTQRELFRWNPHIIADPPISMLEYAMHEGDLSPQVRNQLLAAQFETTAAVYEAVALGARKAAELLGGG